MEMEKFKELFEGKTEAVCFVYLNHRLGEEDPYMYFSEDYFIDKDEVYLNNPKMYVGEGGKEYPPRQSYMGREFSIEGLVIIPKSSIKLVVIRKV